MATQKRVLVIGAGASGLAAIKACKEEGLNVVCYEKTGDIGGVWKYRESDTDGIPSIMKSTMSNTSKDMSSYSDFPAPANFPMYLHHTLVHEYLEMYAENFDLTSSIHYYNEVMDVVPAEDYNTSGKWLVTVRSTSRDEITEESYDAVMVSSGHHAYPYTPTYPGIEAFHGEVIHSHSVKDCKRFEGKSVLVVGSGNSGMDVASEVANYASKVYLSTRRGAWIYPRFLKKGKPLDQMITTRYAAALPSKVLAKRLAKTLNRNMDHSKYGLRPYHSVLGQHPTVNDDIKMRLAYGFVVIKKDIKEFTESSVKFDRDDDDTLINSVIFATGYVIKFPFMHENVIKVGKNNKIMLYKRILPPHLSHPTLGFIGLIQPNSAIFPVSEIQARWFVSLQVGKCKQPSTERMLADVRKVEDFGVRHYVQSQRHTIEVNNIPYRDDLAKDIGAKPDMLILLLTDPKLFRYCFYGPCLPYQYRLFGPHKWEGAREAILSYKGRTYGNILKSSN